MSTTIIQSLTFIIFIVSQKTTMLKGLPHVDNQPAGELALPLSILPVGLTLIITKIHILPVSQKERDMNEWIEDQIKDRRKENANEKKKRNVKWKKERVKERLHKRWGARKKERRKERKQAERKKEEEEFKRNIQKQILKDNQPKGKSDWLRSKLTPLHLHV